MEQGKPPPPHISPTGMWVSKLALRFIQFALAIAIIGCAGSILSSGVWRSITFIVITPQAIVSAIWSLAEGICIIARAGHRGIHPGANVALDLLLWLGLVAGTVLLWLTGVVAARVASSDWPDSYNVDIVYDGYDIGGGDIASVVRMWEALIGLGAALTVLHLTTFIIACVETSKRNRRDDVVVVTHYTHPAQYGYNGQVMGYAPPPPPLVVTTFR